MPIIQWNESMSVNVQELDNQHQNLIQIINDLFDALRVAKGYEVLDTLYKRILDYADYHFSTEEKYFEQFGYPDSAVHKEEHKRFLDQILDYKEMFDDGKIIQEKTNTPLSVELWKFLKLWLIDHIQGQDKQYAKFFNEKGLK